MAYSIYVWGQTAARTGQGENEVCADLRRGDWSCLDAAPGVPDFRRDLVCSEPQWSLAVLLPRPEPGTPADRYLQLELPDVPTPDALRELRYLAGRNRLTMFDPQAAT